MKVFQGSGIQALLDEKLTEYRHIGRLISSKVSHQPRESLAQRMILLATEITTLAQVLDMHEEPTFRGHVTCYADALQKW